MAWSWVSARCTASEDPPAPAIGLGAAGSTRLFLHNTPGLADGGEALEQRHRQRKQRDAGGAREPRARGRDHGGHGDLEMGVGVRPDLQPGVAQRNQSVSRVTGSSSRNRGRIASSDSSIIRRWSTGSMPMHEGVAGQRPRPGAEDDPTPGEVVELHQPVGEEPRMVVRERHHAGPEHDVAGALGGGGNEQLGAGDVS